MRLTPGEYDALYRALLDAFADYDALRRPLRLAGQQIGAIAAPAAMPTVVDRVIEKAEAGDWVADLIAGARADNPGNVALLRLSAAIGLEPAGVDVTATAAGAELGAVTAHLERMVDRDRGIADLGSFAIKLAELMRQVCAVEVGEAYGTGFLIGPQTVLTNHHVIAPALDGSVPVRVRFDYRALRDGLTVNGGVAYDLAPAEAWLVAGAPHSAADTRLYDPAHLPADGELDYAVLRTREPIGTLPATGPDTAVRGWLAPREGVYAFPPDSFLMVVQHPSHLPIAFDDADDAVIRVNANRTRVHYRTNTLPGSSGSPVLDRGLELVALHHAASPGEPDLSRPAADAAYNEGVPIDRVRAHLEAAGHGWVFGGSAP